MAQYAKPFVRITLYGLFFFLSGCTTTASNLFASKAQAYSFDYSVISTKQFDLASFTNSAYKNLDAERLHIYLGGDGQPFFRRHYINPDPTSRRALTLELMSLDDTPSIYIGRPCYHNQPSPDCNDTKWWTSHRYSEPVINALKIAITNIIAARKTNDTESETRITLIGFSGGGTLAVLLAPLLTNIESVVTINPNLHIDAWTDHHGYTTLTGSINPYTQPDLPAPINKHYLIGGQDSIIISKHWLSRFKSQKNSQVHLHDDYDHTCCWPEMWKRFLGSSVIIQ